MSISIIHNVRDGRYGYVGLFVVIPLNYDDLTADDIGRTVIYQDHGRAEAGTLASYRDGHVWARFSRGDTAAACDPRDLCFAASPPYPFCRTPNECAGKGYCPKDTACND